MGYNPAVVQHKPGCEGMMKKSIVVGVVGLILLAAASVYAMGDIFVSGAWRYKMTVTVETPEGIKTGSGVYEVSNSASTVKIIDLPQATNPAKVVGEAVVVDLEKRGKLFALIDANGPYKILYSAFPVTGATTPTGIRYYNEHLKPGMKAILATEQPRLVYFKDMTDPKSVQPVNRDDLAASFGEGVKLQKIEIEITDDSVTTGIEKFLPWLERLKSNIDGTTITTSNDLSNVLHVGNFKKEGK